MIKIFATQFYAGLPKGKPWKSLAYDDSLEDAIESLKAIYDDHCLERKDRGLFPLPLSDFRVKGLESEQEFTED